jgi:hypothetical protein
MVGAGFCVLAEYFATDLGKELSRVLGDALVDATVLCDVPG